MTAGEAPYIIVIAGTAPQPFVLAKDEMSVGRSPDRDIHLDSTEISRNHALFTRRGDVTLLTDLGSSNGTFINSTPLRGTMELRDGDQIDFAGIRAMFYSAVTTGTVRQSPSFGTAHREHGERPGSTLPGGSPREAEVGLHPAQPGGGPPAPGPILESPRSVSSGPGPQPSPWPPAPQPGPISGDPDTGRWQPSPQHTRPPRPINDNANAQVNAQVGEYGPPPQPTPPPSISPLRGQKSGRPAAPEAALEQIGGPPVLLTQAETRIGRIPDNDVVVPDTHVSSRHAHIRNDAGQFVLADLGSSNGTYVNGQRIFQPVILEPGDEIRIGDTDFIFRRLTPVSKKRPKGSPTAPGKGQPKPPART